MGLLHIDEEQMRSYVVGIYAIRFHEPAEVLWSGIIGTLLGEHIPMTAKTITSCKRKSGGGRKRILNPDNEGLSAGILALNGGVSPALATEICNQHNKRTLPEKDYKSVTRNTFLDTIDSCTYVKCQAILRTKTGRRDAESAWAKARVVRCKQTLHQLDLG
jgi:hypothetical protein